WLHVVIQLSLHLPLGYRLHHQGNERQKGQQRCHGKGGGVIVFVVENLHLQRYGIGGAADVARHDRDGAELPHCPGITENDTIDDPPPDIRKGHLEEGLKPRCTQHHGGLLFVPPLGFHQRNQFTGNKGESDEDCCQYDPRSGEYDLYVVGFEKWPKPPFTAENENVDQAGDNRRHRKGEIYEGYQQVLPGKAEFGYCPGCDNTENEIEWHCYDCDQQGQPDRRHGVLLLHSRQVDREPLFKGLAEDRCQWNKQEQGQKAEDNGGQKPADWRRLGNSVSAAVFCAVCLGRCGHENLKNPISFPRKTRNTRTNTNHLI